MFIFTGFWPNNVLRLVSDFKLRSKLILYGGSSESDANNSSLWKQFWIFFLFSWFLPAFLKDFIKVTYNKFTHFKRTIQWFFFSNFKPGCTTISTIQFQNISIIPNTIPPANLQLIPIPHPALGNH